MWPVIRGGMRGINFCGGRGGSGGCIQQKEEVQNLWLVVGVTHPQLLPLVTHPDLAHKGKW